MATAGYDKKVEEEVLAYWEERKIYEKCKEKNLGKKKFYFLQGPPYTSGRIHIGTAWNNVMKDMILRFKRMSGFDVWDRAGYDMHGLPTENKVQSNLGLETKADITKYGVGKFIQECLKFSKENALLMDKDLARLGVWMDFKNAYWPIKNEFIEGEWWLIKRAYESKRLYKGLKVMTWCAACETALAKHELVYQNVKDKSIFLKFPVVGKKNEFLIIWTTTPWTIPFNLAVMVNPELDYVRAKLDNGEVWIVAKALAGPLIQGVADKKFVVVEEIRGEKLEGIRYEHPFEEEIPAFAEIRKTAKKLHSVVLSREYVDASAGSGLVHCAPGCGPEDHEVGKENGLPAFNRIDERGIFYDMGKFSRFVAKKDDDRFVEELRKKGVLVSITPVEHEYAHCWRCGMPVVFRATEQWFMKVEDLREALVRANQRVNWVPEKGKKAYDLWTANLKDNSITRQRFWGCPAPIWECASCKNVIVVGSVKELKEIATTNIPEDLHRPWIDEVKVKCRCGSEATRIPDVLDVWLDSGTTSWNCLYYPVRKDYFERYFPADLILEATEQVRLWFSMLAICSMIALNRPCYENVYMHGMILDYQGMKMSKSLGNIISPYEVIDKHNADVFRYYVCNNTAGENMNFSWNDVKTKQQNLLVLWNTHKFILDLAEELGKNPVKADEQLLKNFLGVEEKYILSRTHSTIKKVTEMFNTYRLDETITELEKLFLELSRSYIQMVREKLADGDELDKEAVLWTAYRVFIEIVKMFSTISPFICEKMFLNMKKAFGIREESITLFDWPLPDKKLIDEKLENDMRVADEIMQAVLASREKARLGLKWPVKSVEIVTKDKNVARIVEQLEDVIKRQVNSKELHIHDVLPGVVELPKPEFAKLGPVFGDLTPKIIAKLAEKSAKEIMQKLGEGKLGLKIDKQTVELLPEHFTITRSVPKHLVEAQFKHGFVYLNTEHGEELEAEGFAREIMRKVQAKRKEAGLSKKNEIALYLEVDADLKEMLSAWHERISKKVGALRLVIDTHKPAKKHKWSFDESVKNKKFSIHFDLL